MEIKREMPPEPCAPSLHQHQLAGLHLVYIIRPQSIQVHAAGQLPPVVVTAVPVYRIHPRPAQERTVNQPSRGDVVVAMIEPSGRVERKEWEEETCSITLDDNNDMRYYRLYDSVIS